MARYAALWAVWTGVGWLAFLLYSFPTWNTVHVAIGGGAALFASAAALVLHAGGLLAFRPPVAAARDLAALPWAVSRDTALVTAALVLAAVRRRRPAGGVERKAQPTGGDDPRGAGRRAAASILGSVAPGEIVVGVDRDADEVLVHRLTGRGG